jgi:hypothetical protein
MPQLFCICVTIRNNPITINPPHQAVPLNCNTKNELSQFASVIVTSQEPNRLETQAAASPLPGSGPKRQRRRRGVKKGKEFFVCVCVCVR